MKTVKKTLLHYQKGTSNKVYNVYLVEVSRGKYLVNFEYGRFGSTLREGSKTSTAVDLESAQKIYDSLVVSKMNKDYLVKEGYDSTKQTEKKERTSLSSEAYKKLLVERLGRVGETIEERSQSRARGATGFRAIHASLVTTTKTKLKKVDNYEVSRLIYRAGELKIAEAKELIVKIYEMNTEEDNAFYYSIAWALGRYRDATLRPILESLREKLEKASLYIVEEALFLLNEEYEEKQIRTLTFAMPFAVSVKNEESETFVEQVKVLTDMIEDEYRSYKNIDSWYEDEKALVKKRLIPLLSQLDELYLKLYMWATIDTKYHEHFVKIVDILPINELNFSLFRRLYKVAELREDQAVLGRLVTKIESKRMACYQTYDYHSSKYGNTVGCSKNYFKKRSFRYLKNLENHNEEGYISFAKSLLLSLNSYPEEFKPFKIDWYDYDEPNWKNRYKHKNYDAFATHITVVYVMYGAGNRYMLEPSGKMWGVANRSIKNEVRPERNRELWNREVETVVEILSESSVLEVQTFAFNILKENMDALNSISVERLLKMMNLELKEARTLFFNVLKEKYAQSRDERIVRAFLLSSDDEIVQFAIDELRVNPQILLMDGLLVELIKSATDRTMDKVISIVSDVEDSRPLVDVIVSKLLTDRLPFNEVEADREFRLLTHLTKEIKVEDILNLMREVGLNERHLFASKVIRLKELSHLEYPLELKEKIANHDHPEMLATTIYLLGRLNSEELMAEHEMLVAFLYHNEPSVHNEARKILESLAKEKEDGDVLLQAIVEKSFASASDAVADNVEQVVKAMENSYRVVDPDQLYRMLIAKSKLSVRLGGLILSKYEPKEFSVVQWARMAKNSNKSVRVWAYDAYMNHESMVQEAMPKSLMIFDTHWEDTRMFASGYFESFKMSSDDIVVIADSNYADVQAFAKKMIEQGDFDRDILLTKLSQHPSLTIQKFVTDLMLGEMSDEQLLKMERFFNTLLHSVNQNRLAKNRVMSILNGRLADEKIAEMYARLSAHHSATMVWADKEMFVEAMSFIREHYPTIELPLSVEAIEVREAI